MKLLGLRLCEHDSNLSYYDGDKVFYIKTERIYKEKHHAYNNLWQWQSDIKRFGIKLEEIEEVAIVIDPWHHNLPTDNEEFYPAIPYKYLPIENKVYRVNHHLAHSLSCWPLYNERPQYEIIIDGFGDMNNSWTVIKDNKIINRGYHKTHGSLGVSMCEAAKFCKIISGNDFDLAGKLMGLQSYGKLNNFFKDQLNYDMHTINQLFDFENYINFLSDKTLAYLQPLDWIKTIHEKISEILIKFFEEITNKDYNANISYSGGVAQNVIWNTALKNKFKNLIIPPHCADDGLSLGGLEFLRLKNKLPKLKINNFPFCQNDFTADSTPTSDTIKETARYLQEGKLVAWYQGNGEIGPRALGNRSLLFNPLIKNAKSIVNKVKKRENYRPFGASILKEYLNFYLRGPEDNKHMLYVGKVINKDLHAVRHVDGTCRYQVVDKSHFIFYNLLEEFKKLTGCPLLLNTSFNVNGKPIMSYQEDAIQFFNESNIDILVIGNKIYKK
tara:strand:+ start:621 stop:2114 length:1494 start_codon:yes stop_codon:yes gene_type:complete